MSQLTTITEVQRNDTSRSDREILQLFHRCCSWSQPGIYGFTLRRNPMSGSYYFADYDTINTIDHPGPPGPFGWDVVLIIT